MQMLASNAQYSHLPLERFCVEMEQMNVHYLDFVPQTPHFWLGHTEGDDPAALRAAFDAVSLAVSVLTPPVYRYAITADKEPQRGATRSYYINALGLARALGADRVVLGASGACWDVPNETLLRSARAMMEDLCDEAARQGVTLLLCPVMGAETPLIAESPVLSTLEQVAAMLDEVDHPNLAAALDTNVMSAAGESILQWFGRLGGRIRLVRMTDGNYHGWRAIGEGVLPMIHYAEQLRDVCYTGDISLLLPGEHYIERPWRIEAAAITALGGTLV